MSLSSGVPPTPWSARSRRERWRTALRAHLGALVVGLLFVALTLYYNVSVPLWEADNEWGHYNYVRYLLVNKAIPVSGSEMPLPETNDRCVAIADQIVTSHQLERQPPLYYLLGALTTFWIDVDDQWAPATNPFLLSQPWRNGYNFAVHTAAEDFPYQGVSLAVHTLRLNSTLIGLAGLVAVYLTGLLIFPGRRYLALAMMAFTAFLPQYVFSASVVNNDIMAAALGFWCVYFCVFALLRKGGVLVLAAAVAMAMLAMLAKYSTLPLIGLVAVVVMIRLVQVWQHDREQFGSMAWQTGLLFMLVTAPLLLWLGRNLEFFNQILEFYTRLFGAFAGHPSAMTDTGKLVEPKAPLDFARAGQYAFITYWGLFGWDSIVLPSWLVTLLSLVSLAALAGVIRCLVDKSQSQTMRWLVLGAVIFLAATWAISVFRSLGTSEPRGRYLLPAYSAASFLFVVGIHEILPRRWRKRGLAALCSGMLIFSVWVPAFLLRPIYAPPVLAASADLLPEESPVNVTFGEFAELIGYRIEPQRLQVWDTARVTLVWRVLNDIPDNYTVSVLLLDGAKQAHGVTAHFPGRGNYATSLWQPGDVFRDTYEVQLQPSARGGLPSLGEVKVAMYCYSDTEDLSLEVADAQGNSMGDAVYLGRLKLAAPDQTIEQSPEAPLSYDFGRQLALEQFSITPAAFPLGSELTVELQWRALIPPARDYTLFVHLVDDQGNTVAASDQPLTGGYYPSGLWDAGERVTHVHRMALPATLADGDFELRIGLYDPATGERLPIFDANEVEQRNAEVTLAVIPVTGHYIFVPIALREYNQSLDQ